MALTTCCTFHHHWFQLFILLPYLIFVQNKFNLFFLSLLLIHQVMLYVDGMNGVMKHSPTIQWLYTLIASKYRLVVKTALKLLLVFVEYCEGNCYLLVNAIRTVDNARGSLPWTNIMKWVSRTSLIWFVNELVEDLMILLLNNREHSPVHRRVLSILDTLCTTHCLYMGKKF